MKFKTSWLLFFWNWQTHTLSKSFNRYVYFSKDFRVDNQPIVSHLLEYLEYLVIWKTYNNNCINRRKKQADQRRICLEIKKLTIDMTFCWRGSISYEAHTDHWCTKFSYFSYISIDTNNGNNTTEKAYFLRNFSLLFWG